MSKKAKKRKLIIVDKTLTPENAGERGYIWWQDTLYEINYDLGLEKPFYDDFNPNDGLRRTVNEDGALLGQPANRHFHENGVGIYYPIKETEDDKKAE